MVCYARADATRAKRSKMDMLNKACSWIRQKLPTPTGFMSIARFSSPERVRLLKLQGTLSPALGRLGPQP